MEAFSRNAIVAISIMLEASLLLLSAAWIYFGKIPLLAKLQFALVPIELGLLLAVATTLASVACFVLGKHANFFSGLRKMSEESLAPLMAKLGPGDIVLISLVSGFSEEVLFRGIIQSQCGLFVTSIIFGIFHDPSFKQRSYVIMAALAGLAMGYLYQQTGNLWSSITAHIVHNLCAMFALRYFIKPVESA